MAAFRAATAVRQAMANAATALIDAGAAAGTIKIYAGAVPASVNDALGAQVLLATLTMSDPAFAAADGNGVATAGAITGDNAADATGAASFFRIADSNGVVRFQGDVTATGGGGDLQLTNVNIQAGVQVDITSFTITQPEI